MRWTERARDGAEPGRPARSGPTRRCVVRQLTDPSRNRQQLSSPGRWGRTLQGDPTAWVRGRERAASDVGIDSLSSGQAFVSWAHGWLTQGWEAPSCSSSLTWPGSGVRPTALVLHEPLDTTSPQHQPITTPLPTGNMASPVWPWRSNHVTDVHAAYPLPP
jgi:hypothetical protein